MPPRRWTTEELDTASNMLTKGASFGDIGKEIDRSAAAVEAKLKVKNTQTISASKPTPKPESQTMSQSTSTAQKTAETLDFSPQSEKEATANDANEGESSTIKYIVGAVIVAVVLWLVFG
jgi:hypothetical protein